MPRISASDGTSDGMPVRLVVCIAASNCAIRSST
jgi:hypothetical protein